MDRPLKALDRCRWCRRPVEGVQLQVTIPSGAVLHWACALAAAERGLLAREPNAA